MAQWCKEVLPMVRALFTAIKHQITGLLRARPHVNSHRSMAPATEKSPSEAPEVPLLAPAIALSELAPEEIPASSDDLVPDPREELYQHLDDLAVVHIPTAEADASVNGVEAHHFTLAAVRGTCLERGARGFHESHDWQVNASRTNLYCSRCYLMFVELPGKERLGRFIAEA
jgi:hypothetical protein